LDFNPLNIPLIVRQHVAFQSLFSWILTGNHRCDYWCNRKRFQSLFSWILTRFHRVVNVFKRPISILVFLDFNWDRRGVCECVAWISILVFLDFNKFMTMIEMSLCKISILVFLDFNVKQLLSEGFDSAVFQSLFSWILTRGDCGHGLFFGCWFQSLFSWILTKTWWVCRRMQCLISILVFLDFNLHVIRQLEEKL